MKRLMPLALLAAGCLPEMDPASYVGGLRVLAIKSEPPEAAAGATTTVTTLAIDPAGRTINIDWSACLLAPDQGMSIDPDCITADGGDSFVGFGSGLQINATVPALTPANVGRPDPSGGVYLPIIAHVSADADSLIAAYRLRLALGLSPPNQNPQLTGVLRVADADAGMSGDPTAIDEATPVPIHAHDVITLRAAFAAGSAETYPIGPRMVTEQLSASWFATAGSFANANSGDAVPDTRFRLDKHVPDPGTIIHLWVVGRDERGGTTWLHRQLIRQ